MIAPAADTRADVDALHDDMCAPIREAAANGADAGTPAFMREWARLTDRLAAMDETLGRLFSARAPLHRETLHHTIAEPMQGHGHPGRAETYAGALDASGNRMRYTGEPVERVVIPTRERSRWCRTRARRGTGPGRWSCIATGSTALDGERNRQIALDYAHRSFDQLTGMADRKSELFRPREGGVEHVGRDDIADWVANELGGHTT